MSRLSQLDELATQHRIKPIILKLIKANKQIIHGGHALNAQVGFPYKRFSRDYDIFSHKKPQNAAKELDKALDIARGNFQYVKQALHKGTWKVIDVGLDLKKGTEDDKTIADFTKKPKRLETINIDGFRFASLESIRDRKIKILKNKAFAFRHEKDRRDLNTLNLFLKKKKGNK